MLLVEGAAGIGKTRLLGCACEYAADAGMTVLTARAAEYEDGYAWGVVRQLFEPELRSASPGDDPVSLAAQALIHPAAPRDEDSFAVLHDLYGDEPTSRTGRRCCWRRRRLHWRSAAPIRHLARGGQSQVLLAVTVREPDRGPRR